MRKFILHVKRLFRKYWFYIIFMFAMSPIIGLANLIIMITISLLFFRDPMEPIDAEAVMQEFTEEELSIIDGETMNENVTDEEYFLLLARFQNFICPKRVDSVTIWNGSEVKRDAYIYNYELNDQSKWYNKRFEDGLKERILSEIDTKGVHAQRLIRTNRDLVYRYWYRHASGYTDVVITSIELQEYER